MKKFYTVLTSSMCGPCYLLKNRLKDEKLEVDTLDMTEPENLDFFRKHGIKSVPRLVIEDGDTVEIVQGIEDIVNKLKEREV